MLDAEIRGLRKVTREPTGDAVESEWDWVSDDPDWVPPAVDTSKPSVARMYDYFLGGKDNFAVDRDAADQFIKGFPDVLVAARTNREYLARAVRAMAEAGIDQFLDLGSGIPTSPSTHEIAREVHPDAAVVYIDNDPVVMTHNRALLAVDDRVATLRHDLRTPAVLLDDPKLRSVLDLDRPVGLLMVAVLHFVDLASGPLITNRYLAALRPGSQIALTIGVRDGVDPAILAANEKVYARTNAPVHLRTLAQVHELLEHVDVVDPGIEDVHFSAHGHIVGARAVLRATR